MTAPLACWCGNQALEPFAPDYLRCGACEALVSARMPGAEIGRVADEERDFYGREYWFSHQEQVLGLASIRVRARSDLPERCLHWLRTALRYRLPPARVLEVGCGHGGFVALLRLAGFEAAGLELSPWVVRFARETFDVPVLQGPLEDQALEPGSLDMIALMDVVEHLRDPGATLARCLTLLKPDGIMLVQTPCYPAGAAHETLAARRDRFLECLQPAEHLYLFSAASFRELFRRLGVGEVAFEPAFFAAYDMFAVVGRRPLLSHEPPDIERALGSSAGGRIVQALLDLGGTLDAAEARVAAAEERVAGAERDRAARLDVIEAQGARLGELEGARNRLAAEVEALAGHLAIADADRTSRLRIIEEQGTRLGEVEGERNRLLLEREQLRERLEAVEADRDAQRREAEARIADMAALTRAHDEELRVLAAQMRNLQEVLRAIMATRAYRLIRRLGYWAFVERMLAPPPAEDGR
jgi:SAM-dependent methyltransferase